MEGGAPWLLGQRLVQKAMLLSGTVGGTPRARPGALWALCKVHSTLYLAEEESESPGFEGRKLRPPLFDSPGGSPAAHTLSQVFTGHQWESGWGSWGGQSQDPRPGDPMEVK